MKVVIIEDEALTAQRLRQLLLKYDADIEVLAVLPSVEESVAWFKENDDPELIFMDIHLEDGQSFSIFETINLDVPVIFTTAYDDYMIQAFKVNSVDYLMKPIGLEELSAAIDKYKKYHLAKSAATEEPAAAMDWQTLLQAVGQKETSYKERFLISVGSRLRTIDVSEVAYFFSADKVTFLTTKDGQRFPIDNSLDKLQLQLDPKQFFRINRHCMASFAAIDNIHVYPKGRLKLDLKPAMKEEVFVSLDRVTAFKDWLGR